MKITDQEIRDVVEDFYLRAVRDPMIGFHFRHIENLKEHTERITGFWALQLCGRKIHPQDLPYNLIGVHKALPLLSGQIDRWVTLFTETLADSQLKAEDQGLWLEKIQGMAGFLRANAAQGNSAP